MQTVTWSCLTTHLGEEIANPASEQMERVLLDLFSHNDLEHPNSWLRVATLDEKVRILDVYTSGNISYSIYADEDEVNAEQVLGPCSCTLEEALRLWLELLQGNTLDVENWFNKDRV